MKTRKILSAAAALAVTGALAIPASSMAQVGTTDVVSGTTLGSLALAVGVNPGFGTTLKPNSNLTNNGTLIVTSTNPVWNLKVKDASSTTPGKMDAATPGTALCTGSAANLAENLNVAVSATGVISAGPQPIISADTLVANTTSGAPLPLAAATLNTSYTQAIGPNEILTAGCLYSLTATYTLQ